jgi:hypothetical protein
MRDFNLVDANGSVSVHSFANAGLAGRYAKKHGLTVAKSVGALALVADAETALTVTDELNGDEIDNLLNDIAASETVETVATDDTQSLRDIALSFDQPIVDAMMLAIEMSFDRRDRFESANGLNVAVDNSYTRERDRMLKNKVSVARFFLALGLSASNVIERQVSSNAMFNAKALKKVTELAQFTCGYGQKLEKVMQAFIACALVATDRGYSVITNEINRRFLNSSGFTSLFKDQDLIDYLDEQSHRTMTSGAETQSSQARNVLDVLGLGSIKTVHKNRDAIEIDATNGFYVLFRERFMK